MFAAQSYVVGMKVNEANFGWQGLPTGYHQLKCGPQRDEKKSEKNIHI